MSNLRGITGVVRRGINSNELNGEIFPGTVRGLLPEEKQHAKDTDITKTLTRMAKSNEIMKVHGKFFTKDTSVKSSMVKKPEVMVLGRLVGTSVDNGKMVAKVEVTSLDYK